MYIKTLQIISKKFVEQQGKTVIECLKDGELVTVWAPGDKSASSALFCTIQFNVPGDIFIASNDSRTMVPAPTDKDPNAVRPAYLKGEKVTRQVPSTEFKELTGATQSAHFAQAASVYGLNLQVVMA